MLYQDVLYLEAPTTFNGQKRIYWKQLGERDYFMQSYLYCYKIKKYPVRHTMRLLYIKHKDTYYRYKKEADILREQYF